MGQRVIAHAKVLSSATPPVPVVVVSIHPPGLAVHELRPVAYELKPFSLAELRAAVEKAVPPAASERSARRLESERRGPRR
jgi:DNA-binding NtrC family response regulator